MKIPNLSNQQVLTLIAVSSLGLEIALIDQQITSIAGRDAWISMALGGGLALLTAVVTYHLARSYPGQDLPRIIISLGGGFFGRILLIPILLYMLLFISINIRFFSGITASILLPKTPALVTMLIMVLVIIYIAKKGIIVIASVVDIIFPLAFGFLIVFMWLAIREADWLNMQPILYKNISNVMIAVVPSFSVFLAFIIFAYIYPYVKEPDSTLKWLLAGVLLPVVFYILLALIMILASGPENVKDQAYPIIILAKSILLPATFLERTEFYVMGLLNFTTIASGFVFCYASFRNFQVLFHVNKKHEKYIWYGHVPVLMILAILPPNIIMAFDFLYLIRYFGAFIGIILLPFLLMIAYIKKKRGKTA